MGNGHVVRNSVVIKKFKSWVVRTHKPSDDSVSQRLRGMGRQAPLCSRLKASLDCIVKLCIKKTELIKKPLKNIYITKDKKSPSRAI